MVFKSINLSILLLVVTVHASDDFFFRIENTIANYTNFTLNIQHAYVFHYSALYSENISIEPNSYFKSSMQDDYFFSESLLNITLKNDDQNFIDCHPNQITINAKIPYKAVTMLVNYLEETQQCLINIIT